LSPQSKKLSLSWPIKQQNYQKMTLPPQTKSFSLFLSTTQYHSLLYSTPPFHQPKTSSNLNIPKWFPSTKTSFTTKNNHFMLHSVLLFLNPQHPTFQSSTKTFIAYNILSLINYILQFCFLQVTKTKFSNNLKKPTRPRSWIIKKIETWKPNRSQQKKKETDLRNPEKKRVCLRIKFVFFNVRRGKRTRVVGDVTSYRKMRN
jgi:hypothetical protein